MIPVTKPFLPDKKEYDQYLDGIWERNCLTNNGPLVVELENRLKSFLGVDGLLYVGNGTIALQLAIKALGLKGEVITTPFSYVATTSSLVWEGCTPVFADIDNETLNIDPARIEEAITSRTSAILATHCFGNPCGIEAIDEIAKRNNLKVIYDAAHGFGTRYNGRSIYSYGHISTASFHATKLFHTIEGGAVVADDSELIERMSFMRNFGHNGPERFEGLGINGKNSELHAAMGLVNLRYVSMILERRRYLAGTYDRLLSWKGYRKPVLTDQTEHNFSYYPIVFDRQETMSKVILLLQENGIFPRRYFYPSLENLPYVKWKNLAVSKRISTSILCLPLYHELAEDEVESICELTNSVM